jgi:hypothetical protein
VRQYADILAFDKNGQLALIAEVKNKRGTSTTWAARMRRNMFAHGLLPNAPYFLLALPDAFYLWEQNGGASEAAEPTQKINPHQLLEPYYEKAGISPANLTGASFELIVTLWLNQVLRAKSPQELNGNHDWILKSGLFDRLAGGHLELEAAA